MPECVACGELNVDDARFCNACGTPLPADEHGIEIRKTVTILFCDVVGSTELGDKTDPETTRRVMTRYAREMGEIVRRHGGTVERFRGDEVMAVFGVPTVHEDDALRAVRAGKEMQRRLASLNDELSAQWGMRLQCRIGINTGEVVAGDPASGESFVTGDAVNVAKRLEQAAQPGEILIGTATYPLVKDAVKFGPRYRFSVKGKREQVEPFRLDDVDATAAGYARRVDAPFVGRDRELAELQSEVEQAFAERRCRLVLVLGPAGIGKTRLVREVAAAIGGHATVALGRCLSYGTGITFWPLVEIVEDLGGLDVLARQLVGVDEAATIVEHIAAATGAADADAPSDEVFWAVRRLFEHLAERRALVVCVDDVHWAEPTMRDLVDYLVSFATGPIALVCAARSEVLEARSGLTSAPSIELDQLTDAETDELVAALGVADAALRAQIAFTADGNPLFAEQLAAAVVESQVESSLADVQLPASINALLEARLDGLEPAERRTLERAAVVGREFSQRAVAELATEPDRPMVARSLLALARKGLIQATPSRQPADDMYRFRHALIRDAAYAGMPKAVRATLHEQLAARLNSQAQPSAAKDEILGYHLEQAYLTRVALAPADEHATQLATRARELLAGAGRRALARDDVPAAVGLLKRATALSTDDADGAGILLDLASALRHAGALEDARETLERAGERAAVDGDMRLSAHVELEASFLRLHAWQGGAIDDLVDEAQRAIPVFELARDDIGLSKAWSLVATVHNIRCHSDEMERVLERALVHAERAGDREQILGIRDGIARATLIGPTPVGDAIERVDRLRAEEPHSRRQDAGLLMIAAYLHGMLEQFDEARVLAERGRAMLEELGLPVLLATTRYYSGAIELLADEPVAAEAELRIGYEAFVRVGDTGASPTVGAMLAQALAAQHRDEEAERFARLSAESASPEDIITQVILRIAQSRVRARRDDRDEAVRLGREGVALAAGTDFLNLRGDALLGLGEVFVELSRAGEAVELLEEAAALYDAKGNLAARAHVRRAVEATQSIADTVKQE
jgi:class 3 adenylate cyclase/tetratricopeptide (TPR) repeat protein